MEECEGCGGDKVEGMTGRVYCPNEHKENGTVLQPISIGVQAVGLPWEETPRGKEIIAEG